MSQKNKDQPDDAEQGHARPEVDRKLKVPAVPGCEPGQHVGGHEKVAKVAGVASVTAQNGALENIPIRAISQVQRGRREQQTHCAGQGNQRYPRSKAVRGGPPAPATAGDQNRCSDHHEAGEDEHHQARNLQNGSVPPGNIRPKERLYALL